MALIKTESEKGYFDKLVESKSSGSESESESIANEYIERSDKKTEESVISKLSMQPIAAGGKKTFEKNITDN